LTLLDFSQSKFYILTLKIRGFRSDTNYIAHGPLDHFDYWVLNYFNCLSLIDGYFNEWRPWNISFCRTDPTGDIPCADADITDIFIYHDSEYLYVKIRCRGPIPQALWPNFYQIFFDSNSPSPGYRGPTAEWDGNFNYLWENGRLFRYIGSGSDWSWQEIMSTPFALGWEDETGMEIAISRPAIGAVETTKMLFNVNAFDLGMNDRAPDDPIRDYYLYQYKPLILIDGNMEDWENMPEDCGNIPREYRDNTGDISDCSGDIANVDLSSDQMKMYFRIQFPCPLPQPLWGGNYYQIFIDIDQNASTGYTACQWGIGAEYLWENGWLYEHTGGNCDWSWKMVECAQPSLYSVGLSDNTQMEISIPRANLVLPHELSEVNSLRFILRVNSGVDSDIAPDSPQNRYYVWPGLVIWGTPNTTVKEDSSYNFTPTVHDVDRGDTLTFIIANKPVWANFDPDTGALTGTPANEDVGITHNIVITVSDGEASASLPPFDLEVLNVCDAPTITGTPATTVKIGKTYTFMPTAYDEDGGTLIFSIDNKPKWATFNTSTGALTGTPSRADIGIYKDIVITVSNNCGKSASLPSFNIEVRYPDCFISALEP